MSPRSRGRRLRIREAVAKDVSAETLVAPKIESIEAAPDSLSFGSWHEAEALRKWSFARRTPQQRLDWLVAALSIAYETGALKAGPKTEPKAEPKADPVTTR